MAFAEDAAAVLEQFVQDVSNLPAEIAHLLEEIEAKDRVVQECRTNILTKDASLQKHFKANGAGPVNPKEDGYTKGIMASYEMANVVQNEKVALSEKAGMLLDRHIKRLDYQIRHLQSEGHIDAQLPTLLTSSRPTPASPSVSTPIPHSSHIPALPTTNITTSALARLIPVHAAATSTSSINTTTRDTRNQSPATSSTPTITTTPATQAIIPAASALTRRDSSSDPSKRRRLGLPGSSSLRQSSLGPGTAPSKASSLSAASGVPRAGSAGPRAGARKPGKTFTTATAGAARLGLLNPTAAVVMGAASAGVTKKGPRRKARKGKGGGVSDTGDESAVSEMEDADEADGATGTTLLRHGVDDEGDGDDRKYCTCRSVSYGNMVACDNDACHYEWFHWSCVGMTKEPLGKWYCDECRGLMAGK